MSKYVLYAKKELLQALFLKNMYISTENVGVIVKEKPSLI